MSTPTPVESGVDMQEPLNNFSQCHVGILTQLEALAGLPALVAAAEKARTVAAGTLALFQHAVLVHHAEEEDELFPAVVRSASEGSERDRVKALVERLTSEHRTLEALWRRVEPSVQAAARGKPAEIDAAVIDELTRAYAGHARFEEQHFLPLAHTILARDGNHMAALGLSLHMRHVPAPAGYI